jgi:leucyl-tRNA synthetase
VPKEYGLMSEETGVPPFRYTAALAERIEEFWQRRWETDGTFHAPNPVGGLAAGFDRVAGNFQF